MGAHFTPAIETTCIREMIAIGRAGEIVSRNAEFIDHFAWAAGSLNAYRLQSDTPDETNVVFGDSFPPPESAEECCDRIEAMLPAEGAYASLSPAQILQLLALVRELWKLFN